MSKRFSLNSIKYKPLIRIINSTNRGSNPALKKRPTGRDLQFANDHSNQNKKQIFDMNQHQMMTI